MLHMFVIKGGCEYMKDDKTLREVLQEKIASIKNEYPNWQ